MLKYYPAVIEKEPDSDFGVSFPDFPGCVSAAGTIEEALAQAEEALSLHIDGLIEDRASLPDPSPPGPILAEALSEEPDPNHRAVYTMVPVQVPGRSKRVNVTLDEALLAEIDSEAENRSAFLDQAARAELARRRA